MNSNLQTCQSQTQQSIVDHIGRYRLTTLSILSRLDALQSLSTDELKVEIKEMIRCGILARAPLFHRRHYFYRPDDAGPHSELAKIRDYAIAAFCCSGSTQRDRLTLADFENHFPDLYRPGRQLLYYMEVNGNQPRLGFVRVDRGGRGRWDRIVAKARSDLCSHKSHPQFRQLIEAEQFEVSILTALPQKAERINETLAAGSHPHDSLIRVTAIPDLLYLLAPPPS